MVSDRALVIGAGGLVGTLLLAALRARSWEADGTALTSAQRRELRVLDVRDRAAVLAAIDDVGPSVVLLPAAWTDVDGCERDPERARMVNVQGVWNVAQAARKAGILLVFYSTDYVFDGRAGPYTEDDHPSPVNVYGETKLAAERLIREHLPGDHLIIRTTGIFGWDPTSLNFATQVWRRLSAGEAMDVPSDQLGTPTLASHLAQTTITLIEARNRGVINVAGADLLSRSEFGRHLARGFGLDPGLIRDCTTAEQGRLAQRPLRAGLRTQLLASVSGCGALGIDEAIARLSAAQRAGAHAPEGAESTPSRPRHD